MVAQRVTHRLVVVDVDEMEQVRTVAPDAPVAHAGCGQGLEQIIGHRAMQAVVLLDRSRVQLRVQGHLHRRLPRLVSCQIL